MGLKEWLIPREHRFFDIFDRQADNMVEEAEMLLTLVRVMTDVKGRVEAMHDVEHKGDGIVHEMYTLLNSTFITPFDREDIAQLTSALDDVTDFTYATGNRLYLYKIDRAPPALVEGCTLVRDQARMLRDAVKALRHIEARATIQKLLVEINQIENRADALTNNEISKLFELDDWKLVIKLKEIYQFVEIATDKAEDAANVIGDVLVKNA